MLTWLHRARYLSGRHMRVMIQRTGLLFDVGIGGRRHATEGRVEADDHLGCRYVLYGVVFCLDVYNSVSLSGGSLTATNWDCSVG